MPYNLLEQQWIPVLRKDGKRYWVRPAEITSDYVDNPVIRLDCNRADFNGALLQFLIGLLQTCSAPEHPDDSAYNDTPWRNRFYTPPTIEQLDAEFNVYKNAFNLDGEYPRFMQDSTAQDGMEWEVHKLLIDGFGASNHFGKYEAIRGIGYRSIAVALISHHLNTTNSAAGANNQHRSSLRNGGFLTTIVASNSSEKSQKGTLWETLWLNVLPKSEFNIIAGNPKQTSIESIFPWMGATRISDKSGADTTPEDAHPLTMYWAMPRRVHINFENTTEGLCSVNPDYIEPLVSSFLVKPDGNNYTLWKHPLTPTRFDENNVPSGFYKTDRDGVRYSDWLGVITNATYKKSKVVSADVVRFYSERLNGQEKEDVRSDVAPDTHVVAFGFMNDNAKILTYRFNEMPLYVIENEISGSVDEVVQKLVNAASAVSKQLQDSLKAYDGIKHYEHKDNKWQWVSNKQKSSKESGLIAGAETRFWIETEASFYDCVKNLIKELTRLNNTSSVPINDLKHQWRRILAQTALTIFNDITTSAPFEQCDMRSILRAELELAWFVNLIGKKNELREILDIDQPKKQSKEKNNE